MLRKETLVCLVILLLTGVVRVPFTRAATFWGTEAKGMGGAYTAGAGGFSGISYNPASSASVANYEFTSNFTRFSQNTLNVNNGSLGLGFGVENVTQGIAVNRTALDFDFDNFSVTSDGLGLDFSESTMYYNASVQPFSTARFGANAKLFRVQSDVEDADADGFGLDLGYQQLVNRWVSLGVSAINLGAQRNWDTGLSEDLSRKIRVGVRVKPARGLSLETNVLHDENAGYEALLMGGEWWLVRRLDTGRSTLVGVALRGGLELQQVGAEETNISAGLSFKMGFGEIHYAFEQKSNFDNQQQFGMTVEFGAPSY
jgi:hypothetical protein